MTDTRLNLFIGSLIGSGGYGRIFVVLAIGLIAVISGLFVGIEWYVFVAAELAPLLVVMSMLFVARNRYPSRLLFCLSIAALVSSAVWPRYAYIRVGGLPGITPTRVVILLSILALVVLFVRSIVFRRELLDRFGRASRLLSCVFVFELLRMLSAAFSDQWIPSLIGFANEFVSISVVLILCVAGIGDRNELRDVLKFIYLSVFLVVLVGFIEFFAQKSLFADFLDVNDDYVRDVLLAKVRDSAYRVQSTFDHPLSYAQFIACLLPMVVCSFVAFQGKLKKFMLFVLFSGLLASIFATGSRSGAIVGVSGVLLTLVLLAIVNVIRGGFGRGVPYLVTIFIGIAVLLLVFVAYGDRFIDFAVGRSAAEYSSTSARLLMFERALPLIMDSPIVGHGVNRAAELIGFVGARGVVTVDSLLLSFAVESGVFALLAYVSMIALGVWKALRNSINDASETSSLQVGFAGALIAFFFTSMTLSLSGNLFLVGFLLASVTCCKPLEDNVHSNRNSKLAEF